MNSFKINPPPPERADLTWRKLVQEDLAALVELGRANLRVDGGLPFQFMPDTFQEFYFPNQPGTTIGGFTPDGRLAACAAAHLDPEQGEHHVAVTGLVHPEQRGKSIGTYLMRWSQAQARNLFAGAVPGAGIVQISTELLTEASHRLYRAHGFECTFESRVMRCDLRQPLPEQPFSPGVTILPWRPDLAEEFYQAYMESFRERPGFPGWSASEWVSRVTENDHVPEWSLLSRVGGAPVGFVIGNIDLTTQPPNGFVWQIGVVPAQRRRGLASALLVETLRRMQAAGAVSAMLTVNANNPGAFQAYERLGFTEIGRRARYERPIE